MSDDEKIKALINYAMSIDEGLDLNTIKISVMEKMLENYHPPLYVLYKKILFEEYLKLFPTFFDEKP